MIGSTALTQNILYLFTCSSAKKNYENEITRYRNVAQCSQIARSFALTIRVNRIRQNCKFYQTTRYYIKKQQFS
jgi:hypothetical protein